MVEMLMSSKVKCPTCRKEVPWENNPHRPFCSDRCKIIDLGSWSQERFRIPAEESEFDADSDDEEVKSRN
jgi:endogenous inhibitor of DNA gyrase (YacG/DUF329 family)